MKIGVSLSELEQQYEAAWAAWEKAGELTQWDSTAGDGVADATQ